MLDTLVWSIFWASVAVFIAMVSLMLVPRARKLLKPYVFFGVIAVLMILGVILLVLTIQKDVGGTSGVFLLLTGASAVGMPVFVILHNLITAMLIKFFKVSKNFDEPVFFILAVIVCPLGLLTGVIGTIVLALNK
ncbi:MAG: hypothetical protein JXA17_04055 [Dehalococcoidales bacterium]|nr:hypothetical protein [Dehalococcoidales bacterium]